MSWRNADNMKEAMAAAKPHKLREYRWCRLRNDFADNPLWRAVAKKARVHLTVVLAIVVRLDALANRSSPRGSVADMSVAEFASALDLRPDVVTRVRIALEEPDIGWIDQDHVVDFFQRNPDQEDSGAKERMRRMRARRKEEMAAAKEAAATRSYPPLRNVTRNTVTVTTRSDQILNTGDAVNSENAPVLASELVVDSDVPPSELEQVGEAELFLATDGKRIVVERMRIPLPLAETTMARWRRELGDDAVALATVIRSAMATALVTSQFHVLISDQIMRLKQLERGPALPLPPVPLKRSNYG